MCPLPTSVHRAERLGEFESLCGPERASNQTGLPIGRWRMLPPASGSPSVNSLPRTQKYVRPCSSPLACLRLASGWGDQLRTGTQRPFPRRRRTMARPVLVLMRLRNPCLRIRFLLEMGRRFFFMGGGHYTGRLCAKSSPRAKISPQTKRKRLSAAPRRCYNTPRCAASHRRHRTVGARGDMRWCGGFGPTAAGPARLCIMMCFVV